MKDWDIKEFATNPASVYTDYKDRLSLQKHTFKSGQASDFIGLKKVTGETFYRFMDYKKIDEELIFTTSYLTAPPKKKIGNN